MTFIFDNALAFVLVATLLFSVAAVGFRWWYLRKSQSYGSDLEAIASVYEQELRRSQENS